MKILALIRSAAAALVALAFLTAPLAAQTAPVVAAASDLQFALEEVAAKFRSETSGDVRLDLGSSGNFARTEARDGTQK